MLALLLIASYLVGAIPFAVLIGRAFAGIDIRRSGSGNTGAMNTLRTAGPALGVLVGLLDAGKGALAVAAGRQLLGPEAGALAGCAAVVGHCFSPFMIATAPRFFDGGWKMALRRSGGKGLATGLAVLLVIAWPVALIMVAIFGLALLIHRKDETWPTIIAVIAVTPAMWLLSHNLVLSLAVFGVALVVLIKHLPDLREAYYVDQQERP